MYRALVVAFICAALAAAPDNAPAATDTAVSSANGFVRARGGRFVTADGRSLMLKGINLGNWLMPEGYMFDLEVAKSPRAIYAATERLLGRDGSEAFWQRFRQTFIRREDVNLIASLGFNTVRVPLHYALFERDGGAEERWALLDRLIDWCEGAGLYVVLDMHAAPGGQTGINHDDGTGLPLLFYVSDFQDRTIAVWRAIAERYKDTPTVLGYDLLNEPIAPYHDVAYLNPRLEPLYKRLVSEIRAVDPNHVIFLAGSQWSSNFGVFGPPFDDNLAYTYHVFWATPIRATLRQFLNFHYLHGVPIWLGESGEADDDWIDAFRKLHERYDIGWCFWTYKNMSSPATVVSVRRPDGWDAVVAIADGRVPGDAAMHRRAHAALEELLENIKLENGTIRAGYVAALGLRPPAVAAGLQQD